jgi:predicted RNA-binding protein with TRAM domain
MEQPVKKGDVINVEVESLGEKGDGIARYNGLVIIVPNTKIGDSVDVEVTNVVKKCAFAKVCE